MGVSPCQVPANPQIDKVYKEEPKDLFTNVLKNGQIDQKIDQLVLDCVFKESNNIRKMLILLLSVDRYMSTEELAKLCECSKSNIPKMFGSLNKTKIGKYIERKKDKVSVYYRWIGPKEDVEKIFSKYTLEVQKEKKKKKIEESIIGNIDNQLKELKKLGLEIEVSIKLKGVLLYHNHS